MRDQSIKPGDRVAYSAQFLRSIGAYTGDLPHARGVVESVQVLGNCQLVTVRWDDTELPGRVLACNLAKVGPNSRFCAC